MPESDLAAALGRVPSGLFVLTLQWQERSTGLLVSWVQQCSFDPPMLTIGLRQGRYQLAWLRQGAAAGLHVLGEDDKAFLRHFAQGFAEEAAAFNGLTVDLRPPLAPRLADGLAFMDLQFVQSFPAGDHDVALFRILDGAMLGDGKPYVHLRKSGLNY